jgi:hypothetical protein
MKPEIILLLDMGLKPSQISKMTGYSLNLIYYYNKQYKIAKHKVNEMLVKK